MSTILTIIGIIVGVFVMLAVITAIIFGIVTWQGSKYNDENLNSYTQDDKEN